MAATRTVVRGGLRFRRIMPHERHICRGRCPTISKRGRCNRPVRWITAGKADPKREGATSWCIVNCDQCVGIAAPKGGPG